MLAKYTLNGVAQTVNVAKAGSTWQLGISGLTANTRYTVIPTFTSASNPGNNYKGTAISFTTASAAKTDGMTLNMNASNFILYGAGNIMTVYNSINTPWVRHGSIPANVTVEHMTYVNSDDVGYIYTIVRNQGTSTASNFYFGWNADVKIGANDRAPISQVNGVGFKMTDGTNAFVFAIENGVNRTAAVNSYTNSAAGSATTTAITKWWGQYNSRGSNLTSNSIAAISGIDSGATFSYMVNGLAAGESRVYLTKVAVGGINDTGITQLLSGEQADVKDTNDGTNQTVTLGAGIPKNLENIFIAATDKATNEHKNLTVEMTDLPTQFTAEHTLLNNGSEQITLKDLQDNVYTSPDTANQADISVDSLGNVFLTGGKIKVKNESDNGGSVTVMQDGVNNVISCPGSLSFTVEKAAEGYAVKTSQPYGYVEINGVKYKSDVNGNVFLPELFTYSGCSEVAIPSNTAVDVAIDNTVTVSTSLTEVPVPGAASTYEGNDNYVFITKGTGDTKAVVSVVKDGDNVTIGGDEYTATQDNTQFSIGNDSSISLTAGAIALNPDEKITVNGNLITNPAGSGKDITVTSNTPATGKTTVLIPAGGKANIGGSEYTAPATGSAAIVIDANGVVTLADGDLVVAPSGSIYTESGVKVTNPAGSGKNITVSADDPRANAATVTTPVDGRVNVGGTEYENAGTGDADIVVDENGKTILESGRVELDRNESIYIDDMTNIKNIGNESIYVDNDGDLTTTGGYFSVDFNNPAYPDRVIDVDPGDTVDFNINTDNGSILANIADGEGFLVEDDDTSFIGGTSIIRINPDNSYETKTAVGGDITIDGTEYENVDNGIMQINKGTDDKLTLTQGKVELDKNEQIYINDNTLVKSTGDEPITVTPDGALTTTGGMFTADFDGAIPTRSINVDDGDTVDFDINTATGAITAGLAAGEGIVVQGTPDRHIVGGPTTAVINPDGTVRTTTAANGNVTIDGTEYETSGAGNMVIDIDAAGDNVLASGYVQLDTDEAIDIIKGGKKAHIDNSGDETVIAGADGTVRTPNGGEFDVDFDDPSFPDRTITTDDGDNVDYNVNPQTGVVTATLNQDEGVTTEDGTHIEGGNTVVAMNPDGSYVTTTAYPGDVTIDGTNYVNPGTGPMSITKNPDGDIILTDGSVELDSDEGVYLPGGDVLVTNTGDETITVDDNGNVTVPDGGVFTVGEAPDTNTITNTDDGEGDLIFAVNPQSGVISFELDDVDDEVDINGTPVTGETDVVVAADGTITTTTDPGKSVGIKGTDYTNPDTANPMIISVDPDTGDVVIDGGLVELDTSEGIRLPGGNVPVTNTGDKTITVDKDGHVIVPDGGSFVVGIAPNENTFTNPDDGKGDVTYTVDPDNGEVTVTADDGETININGVDYVGGPTGIKILPDGTIEITSGKENLQVAIEQDEFNNPDFKYDLLPGIPVTVGDYIYETTDDGVTINGNPNGNPIINIAQADKKIKISLAADPTVFAEYTSSGVNTAFTLTEGAVANTAADVNKIKLLGSDAGISGLKFKGKKPVTINGITYTGLTDDAEYNVFYGEDGNNKISLVNGKVSALLNETSQKLTVETTTVNGNDDAKDNTFTSTTAPTTIVIEKADNGVTNTVAGENNDLYPIKDSDNNIIGYGVHTHDYKNNVCCICGLRDPSIPVTGDASPVMLWLLIAVLCGCALVFTTVYGRKSKSLSK